MSISRPYRFAVLSYFSDLENKMREFNRSLEYSLDYFMIRYDQPDLGAGELLKKGYEVILCYSTFFDLVKSAGYSLVNIQKTDMDIIQALLAARKISDHMAITVHNTENVNIPLLEDLCAVKLKEIKYASVEELQKNLRHELQSGCRVVVGGGFSSSLVGQDFEATACFAVEPTRYSFSIALNRAKTIAQMKRQERLRYEQLLSVLKVSGEGVLFIDAQECCIYSNLMAARLLSPTRTPLAPEEFPAYYAPLHLMEALESGVPVTEELVSLHGRQLIVSVIPLSVDHGKQGAVAFFRDVASLYDFAGRIRAAQKQHGFVAHTEVSGILGQDPAMIRLKELITTYAPHDASVLIHGETGTGKDLVAQAIHNASPRKNAPFLAINCAAVPESLLESELFGYEGGAFTGAKRGGKAGFFEMAHGGSLFLDEVGDLGYGAQLRLLRVLESREVIRVGGNRVIPVDIRIISASHKLLPEMVQKGLFRADLFYRLACLRLQIPPLRKRLGDVPSLLAPLLRQHGKPAGILSQPILDTIGTHAWPGNVRELRSVVESYIILLGRRDQPDPELFADILEEWTDGRPSDGMAPQPQPVAGTLKDRVEEVRRRIVQDTIIKCSWNKQQAAKELGISYNTLWRIVSEAE